MIRQKPAAYHQASSGRKQNPPAAGLVVCDIDRLVGQQVLQLGGGVDKTVGRIKGTGKTQHGLKVTSNILPTWRMLTTV
jgi:hypothetical protein